MQEIQQRQSRRQRGLQAEVNPGEAGAAADAAAIAASGVNTDEDGDDDQDQGQQPPAPAPITDMDENAATIKPPTFKTWSIPTRDPIHVHDHWSSFRRQILRAPYYRCGPMRTYADLFHLCMGQSR